MNKREFELKKLKNPPKSNAVEVGTKIHQKIMESIAARDLLRITKTLAEYLRESHEEEIRNNHSGDDLKKHPCTYCKAITEAQDIIKCLEDAEPPKLIVLCTNDFPYRVLPPGTTEEQAEEIRSRMTKDAKNQNKFDTPIIYYHCHTVPVIEDITNIPLYRTNAGGF